MFQTKALRDLKLSTEEVDGLFQYVKENCIVCHEVLSDPQTNYLIRGNYCGSCNARLGNKSRKVLNNTFIEPTTIEEALML